MKKLLCVAIGLVSSVCSAQVPVDLSNLFSSQNQLNILQLNDSGQNRVDSQISLQPNQQLVERAQDRNRAAMIDWSVNDRVAAIENYVWRHLNETSYTESTYIAELKLGYTQPFAGSSTTFYNLSIASITPSATSYAFNSLSALGDDRGNDRSAFLSLSIHSTF